MNRLRLAATLTILAAGLIACATPNRSDEAPSSSPPASDAPASSKAAATTSAPATEARSALSSDELSLRIETLIPKRETGAEQFIRSNPTYDGRGVVVAVFDTGVDPGTVGLQRTTDGKPKIVDVIDASGAGDVDMDTTATLAQGTLKGLSTRTLRMPADVVNPSGVFRIGLKPGADLFDGQVMARVREKRRRAWEQELNALRTERRRQQQADEAAGRRPAPDKPDADLTPAQREQRTREQLLEKLEDGYLAGDIGPLFDCVVWNDGTHWRALVDTDEDGDLTDETSLRPYGIAQEFASFDDDVSSNFAIQVYDDGRRLSIVTVSGAHGTHVAGIIAAHHPEDRRRDGVAPGAQVLSVRIGDLRRGGSSDLASEMRGVVACAQYRVDLMNASWGGSSAYQNGTDLGCQIYTRLVREYGIPAFVSAGNNGPALSTLGSPGGECPSVIGVGAYVSPEMSEALYSLSERAGNTAFNFSSRGPAKSGDLGVDIIAPGGAIAPVSVTTTSGEMLMHGTSMSSPSAAGVGALVLSAAKQSGIRVTPSRLRTALMNSARYIPEVEVWAQGAGLLQAGPAFDWLKKTAAEGAFDIFFDPATNSNDLIAGPGLYLRRPLVDEPLEVAMTVSPEFLATATNRERTAFRSDVILRPTAPWIRVPDYLSFSSGDRAFRPVIDVAAMKRTVPEGGIAYAEIHGLLASDQASGPLFRIPVTIAVPEQLAEATRFEDSYAFKLSPGTMNRRFYAVPPGATRLHLRLKRPEAEANTRVFEISIQSLASDRSFGSTRTEGTRRVEQGGEFEFVAPVIPGKTTEIVVAQLWTSVGESDVEASVRFSGVESDQSIVTLSANQQFADLRLRSALGAQPVEVTARVTGAIHALHAKRSDMVPLGQRDVWPPVRPDDRPVQMFALRQTFEITVEEEVTLRGFDPGDGDAIYEELGGGLTYAIHESGERVFTGSLSPRSTLRLPKGRTTIHREMRSLNEKFLDEVKGWPLLLRQELSSPTILPVYVDGAAVLRDSKGGATTIERGRERTMQIAAPAKMPEVKPASTSFNGEVVVRSGDVTYLTLPVALTKGTDRPRRPESSSRPRREDPLRKLEDETFDRKLALARSLRTKTDKLSETTRTMVLAELRASRPDDASVIHEEALARAWRAGLVSEWVVPKRPAAGKADAAKDDANGDDDKEGGNGGDDASATDAKPRRSDASTTDTLARADREGTATAVLAMMDEVTRLANATEVAAFFGARPVPKADDKDARRQVTEREEKLGKQRDLLRRAALLRSDILMNLGRIREARAALQEAYRWEADPAKPGEETMNQEIALLAAEGQPGRALRLFQDERLAKDPKDRKLRERRIEMYEKLGWSRWAERERLDLATLKERSKPLY